MSDLLGLGIIIAAAWWVVSSYVKKWKMDNPGKPVVEFGKPVNRDIDWASMEVKGGPQMGSFNPDEAMKW